MFRYCLFIILFFATLPSKASDLISEADSSYMRHDYMTAAKLYEEAIMSEGLSSELYYNLGNAYYRLGKLGKSIINYERALRLNPLNDDAISNLSFVKTKKLDKEYDNRSFINKITDIILYSFSSNGWAIISLIIFVLILSGVIIYIFSKNMNLKKIGFFGGIICIMIFIMTLTCAIVSASIIHNKSYAIILDESVMLSTTPKIPESHIEEAMLLHEGAKIEIIDSVKTTNTVWYDVKFNNNRAWINAKSIEII